MKRVLIVIVCVFILVGCSNKNDSVQKEFQDEITNTKTEIVNDESTTVESEIVEEMTTVESEIVETTTKALKTTTSQIKSTTTIPVTTSTSITTTEPSVVLPEEVTVDNEKSIEEREKEIRELILSYKEKYYSYMTYEFEPYLWKGGIDDKAPAEGGQAFAFMISDQIFGDKKARRHKDYYDVKVGDVIAYLWGRGFLIVLDVDKEKSVIESLTVSKNGKIYWNERRAISFVEQVSSCIWTRWD